jgi:2-C-methyl-D-erythritol 4-phosphate cytidylyltransferase
VLAGGPSRQASIRLALQEPMPADGLVCLHDAARPLFLAAGLEALLTAAATHGGAVPAIPLADTIAEVGDDGTLVRHLDRQRLRALQTPQVFRYDLIHAAHERAAAAGLELTDDTAVAIAAGHAVHLVAGDPTNIKITQAGDLAVAERLLEERERGH